MNLNKDGAVEMFMQPAKFEALMKEIRTTNSGLYRMRSLNPRLRMMFKALGRVSVISPGHEPVTLAVNYLQDHPGDDDITMVQFAKPEPEEESSLPEITVSQEDFNLYFTSEISDYSRHLKGILTPEEAMRLLLSKKLKVTTPMGSVHTFTVRTYSQTFNKDGSLTVKIWRSDQ